MSPHWAIPVAEGGEGSDGGRGVAYEAVEGEAGGGGRAAPRQLFWNLGRMSLGSDPSLLLGIA